MVHGVSGVSNVFDDNGSSAIIAFEEASTSLILPQNGGMQTNTNLRVDFPPGVGGIEPWGADQVVPQALSAINNMIATLPAAIPAMQSSGMSNSTINLAQNLQKILPHAVELLTEANANPTGNALVINGVLNRVADMAQGIDKGDFSPSLTAGITSGAGKENYPQIFGNNLILQQGIAAPGPAPTDPYATVNGGQSINSMIEGLERLVGDSLEAPASINFQGISNDLMGLSQAITTGYNDISSNQEITWAETGGSNNPNPLALEVSNMSKYINLLQNQDGI